MEPRNGPGSPSGQPAWGGGSDRVDPIDDQETEIHNSTGCVTRRRPGRYKAENKLVGSLEFRNATQLQNHQAAETLPKIARPGSFTPNAFGVIDCVVLFHSWWRIVINDPTLSKLNYRPSRSSVV
jgi:hypothetical protein